MRTNGKFSDCSVIEQVGIVIKIIIEQTGTMKTIEK